MENPRPEKVATVAEITAKFKAADGAILTEYRCMSVGAMADLRKQLRAIGAEWKVYKNTYARRAAAEAGLGALAEQLTGPTAVAFVTGDVAAAAKLLRDATKTNPLLVVKGGVMEGKVLSAQEVDAVASLPSREAMLSMFAGLLLALPRNFAYGLKALVDQKEAA